MLASVLCATVGFTRFMDLATVEGNEPGELISIESGYLLLLAVSKKPFRSRMRHTDSKAAHGSKRSNRRDGGGDKLSARSPPFDRSARIS
jgi:hypothetical protein